MDIVFIQSPYSKKKCYRRRLSPTPLHYTAPYVPLTSASSNDDTLTQTNGYQITVTITALLCLYRLLTRKQPICEFQFG
jgi:hypothetical protein